MIQRVSGVVVDCDDCAQAWWEQQTDDGPPFWMSESEAVGSLGDYGWRFTTTGRAGGRVREAVCPSCWQLRLCGEDGHEWLPSAPCQCAGQLPGHLTFDGTPACPEWVMCGRCGHVQEADL